MIIENVEVAKVEKRLRVIASSFAFSVHEFSFRYYFTSLFFCLSADILQPVQ